MISLIESIQKNLGYQQLLKIDPNTQDIKKTEKAYGTQSLTQAAIPAVLCGIMNQLQTPEGIELILDTESTNWLETIFGKDRDEFLARLEAYSGTAEESTKQETEHIANEAIRVLRESLTDKSTEAEIQTYAAQQKAECLLYLPASLKLGDLLNNNHLDDRTHKMEGPISSLMHIVETSFN